MTLIRDEFRVHDSPPIISEADNVLRLGILWLVKDQTGNRCTGLLTQGNQLSLEFSGMVMPLASRWSQVHKSVH